MKHLLGQLPLRLWSPKPEEQEPQVTKAECNARISIPLDEAAAIWKQNAEARK